MRDEQAKQAELAEAVGDVRVADERVTSAGARVAALREAIRLSAIAAPATHAGALAHAEHYRERLRRRLDEALLDELHAKEVHEGVAVSADAARGKLAIARAVRRGVETHFEQWRVAQRKRAERRED